MRNSKNNLSLAGCREPFGKVTELMQVPIALYEILALATEIEGEKAKQIARLMQDVIEVTLDDAESLVKLSKMAENGFEVQFARKELAS